MECLRKNVLKHNFCVFVVNFRLSHDGDIETRIKVPTITLKNGIKQVFENEFDDKYVSVYATNTFSAKLIFKTSDYVTPSHILGELNDMLCGCIYYLGNDGVHIKVTDVSILKQKPVQNNRRRKF